MIIDLLGQSGMIQEPAARLRAACCFQKYRTFRPTVHEVRHVWSERERRVRPVELDSLDAGKDFETEVSSFPVRARTSPLF